MRQVNEYSSPPVALAQPALQKWFWLLINTMHLMRAEQLLILRLFGNQFETSDNFDSEDLIQWPDIFTYTIHDSYFVKLIDSGFCYTRDK